MIEIENITKSYGKVDVLRGISLRINDGEIVSIVGPSGAGKTTLLNIVGTLESADSGSIRYDGTEITSLRGSRLARFRNENIGFVFQFHQLLPEFTAVENVAIPALIGGLGKRAAMQRAQELIERLGLAERAGHKPSQLSGGERQRVAVARALVNNPRVILADEPSGSLDTRNKQELHDLFFTLRDELRQTFVIVTHDEALAKRADRCLHINDGELSFES